MTTRTGLVLFGSALLLAAAAGVWYFTMERLATPYRETNATWRIQGVCTNAQTGNPIHGAKVKAHFTEPIAFKHHWRNPPPLKTIEVETKTDGQGRFEVVGEGGSVDIRVEAEGLNPETWSKSAVNQVTKVDTSVVLGLWPASKSTSER